MNEPVIHGHAVGNARGRGLTDPPPVISDEQAAADRAPQRQTTIAISLVAENGRVVA